MEASALHAPSRFSRFPLGTPLLRLRSDEQLVALFRAGSDEAFSVLHDRYRQRLFAYVRQMLSGHTRQDAEDVLQDVFVRAFGALRGDSRAVNVRAWLYRVAHNRCIDHLRRPHPPAAEIFEMSRKPLLDPVEEAQRRDDLRRLVRDVGALPEQQRSALLMREIDGLSYTDLAGALDVTVPAVKSLLVRARVGLVEAQESRDADCGDIQRDLMASYDRGVKASGRARRHMRECDGCRAYRSDLRGMRRRFAALAPAGAGPLALVTQLLGGGGAAAAGGGGGAALLRRRRHGDRLQGRRRGLRHRAHGRRRGRGPQAHDRARAAARALRRAGAAPPRRRRGPSRPPTPRRRSAPPSAAAPPPRPHSPQRRRAASRRAAATRAAPSARSPRLRRRPRPTSGRTRRRCPSAASRRSPPAGRPRPSRHRPGPRPTRSQQAPPAADTADEPSLVEPALPAEPAPAEPGVEAPPAEH